MDFGYGMDYFGDGMYFGDGRRYSSSMNDRGERRFGCLTKRMVIAKYGGRRSGERRRWL
jgi:hypothetical protein